MGYNVAIGYQQSSGQTNTTSRTYRITVGFHFISGNTALGYYAGDVLTSGTNNVAVMDSDKLPKDN